MQLPQNTGICLYFTVVHRLTAEMRIPGVRWAFTCKELELDIAKSDICKDGLYKTDGYTTDDHTILVAVPLPISFKMDIIFYKF